MPKFKEEIQFPTINSATVVRPKNGVSLFNYNGSLKLLHADGTIETIQTTDDQTGQANLSNYYTKDQIDLLLGNLNPGSAVSGFLIENSLPANPSTGIIYLIPNNSGESTNGYTEYLYTGNSWEIIGGVSTGGNQSASTVMIKDWTINNE